MVNYNLFLISSMILLTIKLGVTGINLLATFKKNMNSTIPIQIKTKIFSANTCLTGTQRPHENLKRIHRNTKFTISITIIRIFTLFNHVL